MMGPHDLWGDSMDAAAIRAGLGHSVVDADGHIIEYVPALRDLIGDDAGGELADRFTALATSAASRRGLDLDTRRAHGLSRSGWWGVPARNTLDRATAMLPRLLYERLDELGIDVAVLYPTVGLTVMAIDDDELRRAVARACNRYYAEAYGPYADRLITVGVIPTYDPDEAIAELEHATGTLGLKGFLFGGLVLRAAPGHEGDRAARWVDGLGLDSAHDYDPLWQRCLELGVSPTFHSTGIGFGSRVSPTNYVANHIGNFAAGTEAVCRSLFFGGAMTRFPELRFAFLEGGVAWACNLLADLVSHYEKRNIDALAHYDPRNLDRAQLEELVGRYADGLIAEREDRLDETLGFLSDPDEDPATLDEWAPSGIRSVDDIVKVFTDQCFFGCEADDPMNALAFDPRINPEGARLRAMFASDIGHWDVPDFTGVLPEAWELVEDGLVDSEQFRDFVFGNVVRLFTGTNPHFFAGTVVADEVTALLSPSA
jgi:predicted TIM-barrel fold metal-dependent hydrolase